MLLQFAMQPGILFFIENGLLYNTLIKGRNRLCILDIVFKDMLQEAYTKEHFKILKTTQELISFYIFKLTKKIKNFIKHYPSCLINATLCT
jgi:hypothetical protein